METPPGLPKANKAKSNIFAPRPPEETREQFVPLLRRPGFKLEYIVSHGQAGEPDFWYDQDDLEWVLLVRGEACLEFEGEGEGRETLNLRAGDYLLIPAHSKHRVTFCSEDALWLALHVNDAPTTGDQ